MTRRRMRFGAVAVPAAVAALSLSAAPIVATAAPASDSAQDTAAQQTQPLGHAIGSAGTLLSVIRALPGSNGPQLPIQLPGLGGGTNGTPLSLGFGLSSAQSNSEVDAPKSLAEAAPFAGSISGTMPATPGSASQSAPPDNANPATGGFDIPDNPLITGGLLNTSAHARYSDKLGPCVRPLAAAKTSTADLSVLSTIPALPDLPALPTSKLRSITDVSQLSKVLDLAKLSRMTGLANDEDAGADNPLNGILEPLKQILGMIDGLGSLKDGASVAKLPGTLSTESTVRLVPIKGSKNKAVQSTSKVQAAKIQLFSGLPLLDTEIRLASQPTLQVTSTGKRETSTISYTKALFSVYQNGKKVYDFDPDNPLQPPTLQLTALATGQKSRELSDSALDAIAKSSPQLASLTEAAKRSGVLSLIGDPNEILGKAGLPSLPSFNNLDLGALRLQIGARQDTGVQHRKGENKSPYSGYELGSKTRLINIQILPSDGLKKLLETLMIPADQVPELPVGKALAEFSFGEQQANAYAPTGGVICGVKQVSNPKPPAKTPPKKQPPLAYTDAAYQTLPLFWTGAGLVLGGAVLTGFRPLRRLLVRARRR